MNIPDIEKFMRAAGQGEYDENQVRAFASQAADRIAEMRKLRWHHPKKLVDLGSLICIALVDDGFNARHIAMYSHISGSEPPSWMIGWIFGEELFALEIENVA